MEYQRKSNYFKANEPHNKQNREQRANILDYYYILSNDQSDYSMLKDCMKRGGKGGSMKHCLPLYIYIYTDTQHTCCIPKVTCKAFTRTVKYYHLPF